MSCLADTNILLRYVQQNHEMHASASAALDSLVRRDGYDCSAERDGVLERMHSAFRWQWIGSNAELTLNFRKPLGYVFGRSAKNAAYRRRHSPINVASIAHTRVYWNVANSISTIDLKGCMLCSGVEVSRGMRTANWPLSG